MTLHTSSLQLLQCYSITIGKNQTQAASKKPKQFTLRVTTGNADPFQKKVRGFLHHY